MEIENRETFQITMMTLVNYMNDLMSLLQDEEVFEVYINPDGKVWTDGFRGKECTKMVMSAAQVKQMNPVVNDENLYIEFYDDISVGNDKYLLCDWIYRDYKNELKATVINFNKEQDNGNITFSNMTVSDAKKYLYQWKNPPPEYKVENIKMNYIDEGYFKVNGNVVLWLSAKIDQPEREKMMFFYYHVHKNRKTYMLSYFTTDFMNNQPNDVILTSLNTLRVK